MHALHLTRRALTVLFAVFTLVLGATAGAWADDAEPDDEAGQTTTETVVVTRDGTKTVRIVTGKDGTFVVEPEGRTPEGTQTRMHVVVRKGEGDEDVQVLELRDGRWVASEQPAQVERRAAAPGPRRGGDPMATVLRWLLTDGAAGELRNDPLKQWFEGGSDVPLAGLRDALRADGWNAESLHGWFVRHLLGGLAALDAPPRAPRPMRRALRGPARGRWFEIGRGRQRLCDECARRMDRCACCGRPLAHRSDGGDGGGYGFGLRKFRAPRSARGRAFLLWNDGSGWRRRAVEAPGRVEHWGHVHEAPHGTTSRGEGPYTAPELEHVLRALLGERAAAPESAEIEIEALDLLPPELLEHVPPEILEGVLKELQGMGLGELLAPSKRACEDCPEAKDGSCPGECEGCATRKADADGK